MWRLKLTIVKKSRCLHAKLSITEYQWQLNSCVSCVLAMLCVQIKFMAANLFLSKFADVGCSNSLMNYKQTDFSAMRLELLQLVHLFAVPQSRRGNQEAIFFTLPKLEWECFSLPKFDLGCWNLPKRLEYIKSEWTSSNLPKSFQMYPKFNKAVLITQNR